MKNMKNLLFVIVIIMASAGAHGQPSFRKPLLTPALMKCPSVYPINVGIKGGVANDNMLYSAINNAKSHAVFSIDGGLAIEWEYLRNVSIGLDAMYASRGTKKSFKTEFLLDYSTSDFAYYDYSSRLRGIEVFLPISFYKDIYFPEDITFLRNSLSKVYIFAGPELYIPVSGKMDWIRYYGDGTVYCEYHVDATKASVRDYYYGFGVGVGFWYKNFHSIALWDKKRPVNTFSITKVDFSCFIESNSLSKQEMAEVVEHVYGWGDLEHETLGKRYGLVFKITGTVLLPVRHKPSGSCSGIGKSNTSLYKTKY